MFKRLMIAGASVAMLAAASPSLAAGPCRDAHGKFVACPAKAAPAKPARCKDAKGKFVKCGTAGAKPA
ncbi:hypothetical protein P6144_15630 [Sphingomonas sp. HITSZ_GF]|uniref:hypothetical protein n=1 Tax=Sphingomonas sp. HITSZ_GF TaxID=3037247 RepID=UPI00240E2465|nr:hypothetical protein [Sphingomonas sp. HITSZ_GF]MDG2535091.1 hypothetical protein [Sphingomonas sp. HITSZ_GF]